MRITILIFILSFTVCLKAIKADEDKVKGVYLTDTEFNVENMKCFEGFKKLMDAHISKIMPQLEFYPYKQNEKKLENPKTLEKYVETYRMAITDIFAFSEEPCDKSYMANCPSGKLDAKIMVRLHGFVEKYKDELSSDCENSEKGTADIFMSPKPTQYFDYFAFKVRPILDDFDLAWKKQLVFQRGQDEKSALAERKKVDQERSDKLKFYKNFKTLSAAEKSKLKKEYSCSPEDIANAQNQLNFFNTAYNIGRSGLVHLISFYEAVTPDKELKIPLKTYAAGEYVLGENFSGKFYLEFEVYDSKGNKMSYRQYSSDNVRSYPLSSRVTYYLKVRGLGCVWGAFGHRFYTN